MIGARIAARASVAALLLTCTGCGSDQSAVNPSSRPARDITTLWWWMMSIAWIALAVVVGILLVAFVRRGRAAGDRSDRAGWAVVLTNGIALPLVVLVALFVIADVFLIRTTRAPAQGATDMTVEVVGHQWWWEFRYPGHPAVTANELHIPTGTRVEIVATTADVIHSFWVPALNRKIDMIPGSRNRIELDADRPGRYRGQCAEFCGLQHSHMGLYVVAEPPSRFQAWLARQSSPSRTPAGALQRQGADLVINGSCADCHTIRGTAASGTVGPDLTHVASRSTLAGLTLSNDRAGLASWITGNQTLKPGNQMPNIELPPDELSAVIAYLESLR